MCTILCVCFTALIKYAELTGCSIYSLRPKSSRMECGQCSSCVSFLLPQRPSLYFQFWVFVSCTWTTVRDYRMLGTVLFSFFASFFLYLLGLSLLVNFNFWFTPCIVEIVRCCAWYWDELVSFCLSVCLPTYTYLPARLPYLCLYYHILYTISYLEGCP